MVVNGKNGKDGGGNTHRLGVIFDQFAFIEHVLQYKTDPLTGKQFLLDGKDGNPEQTLKMDLFMDKNLETGDWQCPILCKKFTDFSKIVAIPGKSEDGKTMAYVLSYEAVHELNFKTNNMDHLITGEKFLKKDMIWLQDPDNLELCKIRDINNFQHIRDLQRKNKNKEQKNHQGDNIRHSVTSARVMSKVSTNATSGSTVKKGVKRGLSASDSDWVKEGKRLNIFNTNSMNDSSSSVDDKRANIGLTSTVMSKKDEDKEPSEKEKLESRFEAMKILKKKV